MNFANLHKMSYELFAQKILCRFSPPLIVDCTPVDMRHMYNVVHITCDLCFLIPKNMNRSSHFDCNFKIIVDLNFLHGICHIYGVSDLLLLIASIWAVYAGAGANIDCHNNNEFKQHDANNNKHEQDVRSQVQVQKPYTYT